MKYSLRDGTFARLQGIVQASAHLRDYSEQPLDAEAELKRIALSLLPSTAWRKAPMILLHAGQLSLADLMSRKKLPDLMCVGEFVSYRTGRHKAMFLYVVWLQDDFTPHMHTDVQKLFADIKWPDPHDDTLA